MSTTENSEEIMCYIKIHHQSKDSVVAACDKDCLGQKLKEGKFQYHVSEGFFKGELLPISKVVALLQKSTNFNVVGENIITKLVELKIIHPEGVLEIEGIPIALKMIF
ncbi:MAG: DUF424 family protein [Candidatus Lokiarchaeota archaeon]|nr:DUF424 family protein [Candidatus Harpocratesius repetitus]